MAIDVDFTQGEVNSFQASGGTVNYGSDGAVFTVSKGGDAPQLTSVFYIMFGRVEFTMKAAPGAGIVSSFVLQSDCLDEIDWEWLGADANEVQTNYFGKGQPDFKNGGYHPLEGGVQEDYHNYTCVWTKEKLDWYIDDELIRTLLYEEANEGKNYPQTPMKLSLGIWAGGDPTLPEGTIAWAGGETDYDAGPYSMYVKSAYVEDFSTGKEYIYGDKSGSWESIEIVE